jgi:LAS superfamily LD-carboxypeptidase LdcB
MKPNWPVRDIHWCEHLKGKKPSQITPDMVVAVSAGGKLEKCAAAAFEEMATAAKADGIILKATSAGDTLRSLSQQEAGFRSRYTKEVIPNASTKHWNNETWYLKPGMAMLATPYDDPADAKARGSRHLYGIAIDIAGTNGNSPILKWLLANEVRFGFSHEVLGDANGKGAEPWHIRFTGVRA